MNSPVALKLRETTRAQIDRLVRDTGRPQEVLLQEVVETGLKSYQADPTRGVKALLNLATWAEEHHITGPADLSTNHNKYAWDEE